MTWKLERAALAEESGSKKYTIKGGASRSATLEIWQTTLKNKEANDGNDVPFHCDNFSHSLRFFPFGVFGIGSVTLSSFFVNPLFTTIHSLSLFDMDTSGSFAICDAIRNLECFILLFSEEPQC